MSAFSAKAGGSPGSSEARQRAEAQVYARIEIERRCRAVWEELMFTPTVGRERLREAADAMQPHQYDDVVTERSIERRCGYPVCSNALVRRRNYNTHITKSGGIIPVADLDQYCSEKCYVASQYFRHQLSNEPVYLRSKGASDAVQLMHDDDVTALAENLSKGARLVAESKKTIEAEIPQAALLESKVVVVERSSDPAAPPPAAPSQRKAIEKQRAMAKSASTAIAQQFGMYERVMLHLSGFVTEYTRAFIKSELRLVLTAPQQSAEKEEGSERALPVSDGASAALHREAIFYGTVSKAFAGVKKDLRVEHNIDADAVAIARTFDIPRHFTTMGAAEMRALALLLLKVYAKKFIFM